jgi:hypothetical protein
MGFALGLAGYVVGILILFAASQRQQRVTGGDGWGFALALYWMVYPFVWLALAL